MECKSVESQSLDLEKEGMVRPTFLHSPTLDLSHYRMVDGMFSELYYLCFRLLFDLQIQRSGITAPLIGVLSVRENYDP